MARFILSLTAFVALLYNWIDIGDDIYVYP